MNGRPAKRCAFIAAGACSLLLSAGCAAQVAGGTTAGQGSHGAATSSASATDGAVAASGQGTSDGGIPMNGRDTRDLCHVFTLAMARSVTGGAVTAALPLDPQDPKNVICTYANADHSVEVAFSTAIPDPKLCVSGVVEKFEPVTSLGQVGCYLDVAPSSLGGQTVAGGQVWWRSRNGFSYGLNLMTNQPDPDRKAQLVALAQRLEGALS